MARKAEAFSRADLEAWARYLRHVRPLPGAKAPPLPPPAPAATVPEPAPSPTSKPAPSRSPRAEASGRRAQIAVGAAPGGLDRATWTRFRTGRIPPERTLDLHGMTTAHAHLAVNAMIAGAAAKGLRCVEIVTGHGRRNGGEGVLRREVPFWLNDASLRPLILAVCHPHAANQGALRVLLRRTRQW